MDTAPEVEYRPIPGHDGYRVTSAGQVESRRGPRDASGNPVWRRLAPSWNRKNRCLHVSLYAAGRRRTVPVAVLVLTAFRGPKPQGREGCHLDGDARNCALGNLEWCTHSENMGHAVASGSIAHGERTGTSKLTARQVLRIRRLLEAGRTHASIGRRFGVARSTVGDIATGRKWRRVA